jgi:hypothetical protein
MTDKVVSFHDDPPSEGAQNKYKAALERAKATQRERPSDLKGTPRFDQTTSWKSSDEPKPGEGGSFLSPDTKKGLEDMAKTAKRESETKKAAMHGPAPSPQASVPTSNTVSESPTEQSSTGVPTEETEADRLRSVIENRLSGPIDIGEYLMTGEARQSVPIIPKKLIVEFKTVTDQEESFVDTLMSEDQAETWTNRQFLRRMNELALCIHIHSVNGKKWPLVLDNAGNINKEAVDARLKHVKKLSSPVFNLLTQNLGWFIERVNSSLTAEALGNG